MTQLEIDKNEFSERLKAFIAKHYKYDKSFADAMGIHQQIVSSMVGKRKTKPTYDFFYSFLKIHSVDDLNTLLYGNSYEMKNYASVVNDAGTPYGRSSVERALVGLIDSRIEAYRQSVATGGTIDENTGG